MRWLKQLKWTTASDGSRQEASRLCDQKCTSKQSGQAVRSCGQCVLTLSHQKSTEYVGQKPRDVSSAAYCRQAGARSLYFQLLIYVLHSQSFVLSSFLSWQSFKKPNFVIFLALAQVFSLPLKYFANTQLRLYSEGLSQLENLWQTCRSHFRGQRLSSPVAFVAH